MCVNVPTAKTIETGLRWQLEILQTSGAINNITDHAHSPATWTNAWLNTPADRPVTETRVYRCGTQIGRTEGYL